MHPNNYVVKFAADTAILSLLHKDMDPNAYQDEIDLFIKWCDTYHLILYVTKTKEMVFDQKVTQVSSYKYRRVHIDDLLCWETHIDNLLCPNTLRTQKLLNRAEALFFQAIKAV